MGVWRVGRVRRRTRSNHRAARRLATAAATAAARARRTLQRASSPALHVCARPPPAHLKVAKHPGRRLVLDGNDGKACAMGRAQGQGSARHAGDHSRGRDAACTTSSGCGCSALLMPVTRPLKPARRQRHHNCTHTPMTMARVPHTWKATDATLSAPSRRTLTALNRPCSRMKPAVGRPWAKRRRSRGEFAGRSLRRRALGGGACWETVCPQGRGWQAAHPRRRPRTARW